MNLRDFIKQALTDIFGAVQDAQKEITAGEVVPSVIDSFKCVETGISDVQAIEFDVSVNADKASGSEAKLSVVAAVIGGSVKGQSNSTAGHTATLKFKIPVRLPKKE